MSCTIQQQYNCCCSLRKGSLVASACLCISTIALLFAFLPIMNVVFKSFDLFVTEHPEEVLKQYLDNSARVDSETLVPRLIYSLIYLIIVTVLAVGVSKNSNKFLLPWLIFMGLHCIAGIAGAITILVYIIFIFTNTVAKLIFTIFFFLILPITAMWLYFVLCVWSYYKELQEQNFTTKSSARQTAV